MMALAGWPHLLQPVSGLVLKVDFCSFSKSYLTATSTRPLDRLRSATLLARLTPMSEHMALNLGTWSRQMVWGMPKTVGQWPTIMTATSLANNPLLRAGTATMGPGQFSERHESQLRAREPDLRAKHVSPDCP